MKWLALFLGAVVGMPAASAMDAPTAYDFLQGSWAGQYETWIFDKNNWQQFNGGTRTDTAFSVVPLPENLFTVVSAHSGRRYVVHVNPVGKYMTWYIEGEVAPIGQYFRMPKS